MKLTVVGCSGSLPGPESAASSYLVEADGFRLVLDLGSGAMGPLQRYVAPHLIDAVVLSHLHPDHCADVSGLAVALQYGAGRRTRRLPVIGPAHARERIAAVINPDPQRAGDASGLDELFEFRTPDDGELGPFTVSYARVNHPVPTYAVRIAHGGRALVYSADTGESSALVALALGADLFLCESTFAPDDPYRPNLHLTGRQAGTHAARAEVGQLVVTHVPPDRSRDVAAAEAAKTFGRAIEAAVSGAQYEL